MGCLEIPSVEQFMDLPHFPQISYLGMEIEKDRKSYRDPQQFV